MIEIRRITVSEAGAVAALCASDVWTNPQATVQGVPEDGGGSPRLWRDGSAAQAPDAHCGTWSHRLGASTVLAPSTSRQLARALDVPPEELSVDPRHP